MIILEIEWWSYFGYLLKVKLSEYSSRLDVGEKKEREEPRMRPKFSVTAVKRIRLQLTAMGKTMRGAKFGGEIKSSFLKHPSREIKLTTRCVNVEFQEEVQTGNVNLGVIRILIVFKNTSMDYVTRECIELGSMWKTRPCGIPVFGGPPRS